MNFTDMMDIVEAGYALRSVVRDYYSLEYDGKYGETYQFTDEEIIDAMGIYFKDDVAWKNIHENGADSQDAEAIRDIVVKDIRNENVYI